MGVPSSPSTAPTTSRLLCVVINTLSFPPSSSFFWSSTPPAPVDLTVFLARRTCTIFSLLYQYRVSLRPLHSTPSFLSPPGASPPQTRRLHSTRARVEIMSYYRGTHSPRDSGQYPTYTNPLSPPRNSNRLSGGIPSSQKSEEVRSGMSRRFTTNTVPSLSPLGQQRLLAAGDVPMVSFDSARVGGDLPLSMTLDADGRSAAPSLLMVESCSL